MLTAVTNVNIFIYFLITNALLGNENNKLVTILPEYRGNQANAVHKMWSTDYLYCQHKCSVCCGCGKLG